MTQNFFHAIEDIVKNAGGMSEFKRKLEKRWTKKIPVNTWAVRVEVRPLGAQGKFEEVLRVVRAEEQDVTRFILEDCEMEGLEVRFIKQRKRLA